MWKMLMVAVILVGCGKKKEEAKPTGDHTESAKGNAPASRHTEAEIQLNKIAKNAKVYYVSNAKYPAGTSKTLPDKACCPKCDVTTAWAQDSVWSELDFQIDEPNLFQYTYTGKDNDHATVTAVGDLDCDGTTITYTLDLSAESGNPSAKLTPPPANSD